MRLKPLYPSFATDCDLKILSVLLKSKQWVFEKKCFHVLFHVIITKEVPVTILQAYRSFPRHIRKGVLIRQSIASDLSTAIFPSLPVAWSLCDVLKPVFLVNQNRGHKQPLGRETTPLPPPPPPQRRH